MYSIVLLLLCSVFYRVLRAYDYYFIILKCLWLNGRMAMQRTANPCKSVRFRLGPRFYKFHKIDIVAFVLLAVECIFISAILLSLFCCISIISCNTLFLVIILYEYYYFLAFFLICLSCIRYFYLSIAICIYFYLPILLSVYLSIIIYSLLLSVYFSIAMSFLFFFIFLCLLMACSISLFHMYLNFLS